MKNVVGNRPVGDFRDKERLPSLRLFRGVTLDAVEGYLDAMGELWLEPNEILLQPDQRNHHVFLILEGQLQVHLESLQNAPWVTLDEGECAGEMSIIQNDDASAYVVSTKPTRLLVIEQQTLWSMINNSHAVARNLLHILAGRVRSDNNKIVDVLESQREWEHNALVDALTGLHNRRWLQQTLSRVMERARRDGTPLSLLMADLDNFKQLNDTFGHLVGDLVLASAARTLREHLRPNDTATRFGGEEFVVVLPSTTLEDALLIAERLRLAVGNTPTVTDSGMQLPPVKVSIGVAEMHADMDSTFLLNAADAALYRAKAQGRDRVAS